MNLILRLSISFLLLSSSVHLRESWDRGVQAPDSPSAHALSAAKCEATGTTEIQLDCTYREPAAEAQEKQKDSGIFLRRAVIAFEPIHQSQMRIKLSLTNEAALPLKESRTVYIAFDDAAGQNYIRRPLPHVVLKNLVPGELATFEDEFLAPALEPGRYFVHLWIPDLDSKFKMDATHNLLLANEGMAEPASGLNRIATVIIEKATRSQAAETHGGGSKP